MASNPPAVNAAALALNKVAEPSDAITRALPAWMKIDALVGGTETMRAAGSKYLPKWPQEGMEDYNSRLSSSFLFNAFGRTLSNLAGKPFKEAVSWIDTPDEVVEWFDDIDMAGRKLDVFAQEVFFAGLRYGLTHVLADIPPSDPSVVRTKQDEQAAGIRPYLVHIKAPQVLGWRSARIAGVEQLTMFRYMETVTVDNGDFGSSEIQQVRVLTPGAWATYRQDATKQSWALFENGTTSRTDIPLTTFYTARTDFMTADPPLEDLADMNIEHWQSSSDQRNILHTARVPILCLSGVNDTTEIVIGTKNALQLPQGATAKWVESDGHAIGAGRQDLQDLEDRMRLMGAELLVKGPGKVSATQAALDTSQQQTYLSAVASQFEDFLDECIVEMAEWKNIDVSDSHIAVYKDFGIANFDNAEETLLVNAANAGYLSRETLFNELKRRGTINGDIEWEDEEARILSEPPLGGALPPPQPTEPRLIAAPNVNAGLGG